MERKIKVKTNNIFVITVLLAALLCGLISFSACDTGQRYSNTEIVDGIALCSNKLYKKSLAKYCEWDGDMNSMEFTVPDEYNGYKVKCLGAKGNPGFTGDPGSFRVHMPDIINGYESLGYYSDLPPTATAEQSVNLEFKVNLGKYVNEITNISKTNIFGYGTINYDDEGKRSEEPAVFYCINTYYIVNADNSAFYSQDGDIYYKSNNKKVQYRYL
ncbi:MAG: hypothetical protein NC033_06480 [Clostridiales bacterium]|nr:hypothetical protein [Clostridiales bacterium]